MVAVNVSVGVFVMVEVGVKVVVLVEVRVAVAELVGVGLGIGTVKLAGLIAVPPGLITLIRPLVAPAGTLALIDVAERMLKIELVPLNFTLLARVKLYPLMVTLVPVVPLVGEKPVMDGGTA